MKENLRLKHSLIFPIIFLLILWIIKFFEYSLDISFANFGVYPLKISGLKGILFSPLIHGSFKHLISNSTTLFVFMVGLFYFHKKDAFLIFSIIYLSVGLAVWLIGRYSYHIGASGVVYGLASFHFFTGVLSKRKDFIAISLLLVFLYGSMIWGIFPSDEGVSWESHFMGFIIGIILSLFYYEKLKIPTDNEELAESEQLYLYDFEGISYTEPDIEVRYFEPDAKKE